MKPIAPIAFADPAFVETAAECPLLQSLIRPHFTFDQERLIIFGFDKLERLVGMTENDDVHPRRALLCPQMVCEMLAFGPSSNLLVVHNHPSGDVSPSRHDLDMTQRLAIAAQLIGFVVRDHLILTEAGHFSFRAAGLL